MARAWESSLLEKGLQCPICIDFFNAPLTLGCGHTFCRLCLLQSTRLAPDGRCCPECRAPIEIRDPLGHPTNAALESELQKAVPPDALAAREAADELKLKEVTSEASRKLPIFQMRGVPTKPGEIVALHFFEPRYRILIRRAWEGNRRFLCTPRPPRQGDTGLVVHVDNARFLPDGRVNIEGRGVEVVTLQHVWVEADTGGLQYAEVAATQVSASEPLAVERSRSQELVVQRSRSQDARNDIEGSSVRSVNAEQQELPVFCMNAAPPTRTNRSICLRFFEPRYRVLARETWASPLRLFLYAHSDMRRGDEAMLVSVDECRFDARGDAVVKGTSVAVIRLGSFRQDVSKGGLFYAKCLVPEQPQTQRAQTSEVADRGASAGCCSVQ